MSIFSFSAAKTAVASFGWKSRIPTCSKFGHSCQWRIRMCVLVHSGDLMTSCVSIPRFSSSTRPASRAFLSSVASRSSAISLSFRLTIGFDDSTHGNPSSRGSPSMCEMRCGNLLPMDMDWYRYFSASGQHALQTRRRGTRYHRGRSTVDFNAFPPSVVSVYSDTTL